MACAHPLTISHGSDSFQVPCRQCMPCRVAYQSQILFAATNELYYCYRRGMGASFCCFTYSDDNLPLNGSLRKKDLQDFNKRVRSAVSYYKLPFKYKYVACGEYGDKFERAHYHIIFIGLSDVIAKELCQSNWPFGLIDVGPLGRGGLRYVLKYCTKQLKGAKAVELYDSRGLERPFLLKSVKLGYDFLADNRESLIASNWHYNSCGKSVVVPSYYRKRFSHLGKYQSLSDDIAANMVASNLGFSLPEYRSYIASNLERMLISDCRQRGLPVDDRDYIIDKPYYMRYNSIDTDSIVDPLPF